MDKLKQVQKYQFWILLGVAIVLPLVGWFLASSQLSAAVATRQKKLEDLQRSLTVGPDDPNGQWEQKVSEKNKLQADQVAAAWYSLWETQKSMMTWPPDVQDDPSKFALRDQDVYRTKYLAELRMVHQVVRPLDENGENGLVDFPETLLPAPHNDWTLQPPTPPQMEAAQEDLWLLASLLRAIQRVNQNAASKYDAPLRMIKVLALRGGSKGGGGSKSASGSSPGGGTSSAAQMAGAQMDMLKKFMPVGKSQDMGGPASAGQGQGKGASIAVASFNPDDEFGPEVEAKVDTKSSAKDGSKSTAQAGQMERYIENKTEWKTRGFYLEVVMDHRNVPTLLAELSNSEWPTKITRVHQADFQDEDLVEASQGAGGGGGGVPGMAGGLMPGGGGAVGMPGGGGAPGGMQKMMAKSMKPGGGGVAPPTAAGGLNTGGGAARPSAGAGASVGIGTANEEGNAKPTRQLDALNDPNLANVAVDGLIYIFKKPPENLAPAKPAEALATAPQPGSAAPAAAVDASADGAEDAGGEPAEESAADSAQEQPTDAEKAAPPAEDPQPRESEEATEAEAKDDSG
jgi:hypothetical protein